MRQVRHVLLLAGCLALVASAAAQPPGGDRGKARPKDGDGNIGICKPHDGQPARGGNGIMIAFVAWIVSAPARQSKSPRAAANRRRMARPPKPRLERGAAQPNSGRSG